METELIAKFTKKYRKEKVAEPKNEEVEAWYNIYMQK
jgi:hypothetical protein